MKSRRLSFTDVGIALIAGFLGAPYSGDVAAAPPANPPALRDGAHDFDFELGKWTTHLRRLQHPLSSSTTWIEYEGTTDVLSILEGRANMVELQVTGPAGRIDALSLRLYEPESHQWTLNFANIVNGQLTSPMTGGFNDGRGEFYGQDTFNGRAILVRFVITKKSSESIQFEQAFSTDGGRTWEANWLAVDQKR
jgi:hypothetical protein